MRHSRRGSAHQLRNRFRRRLLLESLESRRVLATFTVDTLGDEPDDDFEDGICRTKDGGCTFLAAIINANRFPDRDVIEFNIPGSFPNGIPSISTAGVRVTKGAVEIRGDSQPGAGRVELSGTGKGGTNVTGTGIFLTDGQEGGSSGGSLIRNLVVNGFLDGIIIESENNTVVGTYIGTDVTGEIAIPNNHGIRAGSNNTIGGFSDEDRNIISGNFSNGMAVGSGSLIVNNYIGTNKTGLVPLGNGASGLTVSGAQNTIGDPQAGNIIAGSGRDGILLSSQFFDEGNEIYSNLIGTDVNGEARNGFGNADYGIRLASTDGNFIGGVGFSNTIMQSGRSGIFLRIGSERNTIDSNVIGGSGEHGIHIAGNASIDNVIRSNKIGTDATGEVAFGNQGNGIFLDNVPNTIIESSDNGPNIIAGNGMHGIEIIDGFAFEDGAPVIRGAVIGLSASGSALPNGGSGIRIFQQRTQRPTSVTIGPDNVISSNMRYGVEMEGGSASLLVESNNQIIGSFIGTSLDGQDDRGNTMGGVLIKNLRSNTIGGTSSGQRNIISGNDGPGVQIEGLRSQSNTVQGSWIGAANPNSMTALGNQGAGILLTDQATNNQIGAPLAGARLVVSANESHGIELRNEANQNTIIGTFIGTDQNGNRVDEDGHILGNAMDGIFVNNVNNTQIGGTIPNTTGVQTNVISGNDGSGIRIEGFQAFATIVQGNIVGATFVGLEPLGNGKHGLEIRDGASGNLIGGIEKAINRGNLFVNNRSDGISIVNAVNNAILKNEFDDNGHLGIDLGDDGVTSNDPVDSDQGANSLQNFPLISKVEDEIVTGVFEGIPDTDFRIELFSTTTPDPSGHGEGRFYLGCTEIRTNNEGRAPIQFGFGEKNNGPAPFCDQRIVKAGTKVDFTMTATHINEGNTSEFSPIFSGNDLSIREIDATVNRVVKVVDTFRLPVDVIVVNDSHEDLSGVIVELTATAAGGPADPLVEIVDLPKESETAVTFMLDLNNMLDASGGLTSIQLAAEVDVANRVVETVESNNQFTAPKTIDIDARPVVEPLRSEYKLPAYFLSNFDLRNRLDIFVSDWNGNLPDNLVEPNNVPLAEFSRNGASLPIEVGSLNPVGGRPNFTKTIRTDRDLDLGNNTISATVHLGGGGGWDSEPIQVSMTQLGSTAWLTNAFSSLDTTGPRYNRVTEYKGGFEFPEFAVEGFFDLPVERVSFLAGALGSDLQFSVQPSFKTDGTSSITGGVTFNVEIGDTELSGGTVSTVNVSLTGNLKIDSTDQNVALESVTVSMQTTHTFKGPKKPIFVTPPIFASGFAGAGLTSSFNFVEDANGDLVFDNTVLRLDGTIGGSLLAGLPKIAYLEGTVSGTLATQFQLPPDPDYNFRVDTILAAQAKVKLLTFEVESPRATYTCTIFGNGTCGGGGGEGEVHARLFPSQFVLSPRKNRLRGEGQGAGGLPEVTYEFAAPSLAVNSDGTRTLVYVDEDPNKANGQQLEIYASTFDGAQWSTPVALTDDTQLDDRPQVSYDDNGRAIAVWSRVKNTITDPNNTQPDDFLDEMEIFYAVRDPSTGVWSEPAALTSNETLDFLPRIENDSQGNVVASWRNDSDNRMPITGDEPLLLGADIVTATWDGSSWSTPTVAVSAASSGDAPQFATEGDDQLMFWSEDADGSLFTIDDRSIQYASFDGSNWSPPQTLAGGSDGVNDESPRVTYDSQGLANVVWVKTGVPSTSGSQSVDQLWFTSQNGSGFETPVMAIETEVINDPTLLKDAEDNLIVVWQGQGPSGLDLYYTTYELTTGQWSPPTAITDTPDADWAFQPFINSNGELEVFYLERGIEPASGGNGSGGEGEEALLPPDFTSSDLVSIVVPLAPDLKIPHIEQSNLSALPGSTLQITATVENHGAFSSSPVEIVLLDNGSQSGVSTVPTLKAGETYQITMNYVVPVGGGAPTLEAKVDPTDQLAESNETNNSSQLAVSVQDASTIVLPSPGTLYVFAEADEVVAQFDGSEIFRQAGSSIAKLNIIGSAGDDSIEIDHLDLVLGNSVSLSGGTGSDSIHLLAFDQSLMLTGDEEDTLRSVEEINVSGIGDNTALLDLVGFRTIQPTNNLLRVQHDTGDVLSYGPGWSVGEPQIVGGQFVHILTQEEAKIEIANTTAYHNPLVAQDSNYDGFVSPIDALIVINDLNSNGSRALAAPVVPSELPISYLDVNGDNFVSSIDALIIINFLNSLAGGGEGEHPVIEERALTLDATPILESEPANWGAKDFRDSETILQGKKSRRIDALPTDWPARDFATERSQLATSSPEAKLLDTVLAEVDDWLDLNWL